MPPKEAFQTYAALDSAVAQLCRAMVDEDNDKIVSCLNQIHVCRNLLVNELQAWRPQLRIAA